MLNYLKYLTLLLLFISTQFVALANTNETTHKESLVEEVEHEAKEVEHEVKSELHTEGDLPKDVTAYVMNSIMTHVADANEYHIATIDHKHIVLPLPCILINKETKKVSVFMSSKLHKVHEYDGYAINHETGRVIDAKTHDRSTFYDLSITKNVFHMILGFIVLALIFFKVKKAYEVRPNQAPKGLQGFMEPIVKYLIDDVIKQNIPHHYEKYTVFILCIFFFILINNLLGLVPFFPGSANLSGNIAFTMTLAIFAGIM
ncbi:MAG: F0F1 ATP synthase subunit A, partial [Chitinophagales bacterium]